MIAIPLDTKDSIELSKLYGRAPFFALLDTKTGDFEVIDNEVKGKGPKSAAFLQEKNVSSTLFYHMGEGVYDGFVKNKMDVYTADYNTYTIKEIYDCFIHNKLTQLTDSNYKKLLDPGAGETCTCSCEK